jgi:hypothetical protein
MSKTKTKAAADAQALYLQRRAALQRAPRLAAPDRITNTSAHGTYTGHETGHAARSGSEDFLNLPSRIGDVLHYRDKTSQPSTHATRTTS